MSSTNQNLFLSNIFSALHFLIFCIMLHLVRKASISGKSRQVEDTTIFGNQTYILTETHCCAKDFSTLAEVTLHISCRLSTHLLSSGTMVLASKTNSRLCSGASRHSSLFRTPSTSRNITFISLQIVFLLRNLCERVKVSDTCIFAA